MTSPPPETTPDRKSEELARRGDRFFKAGAYPSALGCYEEALALDPEYPLSLLVKAALLSRLGQPEAALQFCEKHLEFRPRDAEGWKLKSRLCAGGERKGEALEAIRRARQLQPEDVELLLFQGYLLADIFGEPGQAIECYDAALVLRPRDPAIWRQKGRALHNLDAFRKAIACFNRSLRLNRREAGTWKDKGDAYNCLALEGKALACYKKAIRLDPGKAAYWHIAALTYDDLGREKNSLACYRKVLECAGEEDGELANQARLALAEEKT